MTRLMRLYDKNVELDEITGTTTSDPIDLDGAEMYSVQAVVDVNTPSAKTFDSQRFAIDTVNFADKAATTAGDYFVFYDAAGLAWAAAMNKAGSDPAPTGAIYTAIAAGRKVNVDISSATNDEDIAALVETALNALTGFSAAFTTDDTAADGTMLITRDAYGPVTAPVVKNANDSGAGSITCTTTTTGLTSEVTEGAGNSVSIPTHGYFEGLKGRLTTTGTLPAGVTTGVDYFIIVVDANTVQFAASLADALAGTAIDITDEGTGVHTFTATALAGATVKIQKSNSPAKEILAGAGSWDDVAAATAITVDANVWFEKDRPSYRWIRISYTLTAGSMSTDNYVLVKGSP